MKLTQVMMMGAMAACFAMPAMAADTAAKGDANSHWAMMDTDGDGKISKAEWDAAADKKFDEIDTNHDGFISKEEWAAKGKMMKHAHKAGAPMSKGSTSTPADNNQAAPAKAPAAEGADGAGGATAQ